MFKPFIAQQQAPVIFSISAGPDSVTGTDQADTIDTRAGDDQANGGKGDDRIDGGEGKDDVRGGADNDVVAGGADDDYVSGDEGNDEVSGGSGRDTVRGGTGSDVAFGGPDEDRFVFSPGDVGGSETIGDYEAGELIDIGGIEDDGDVRLTPGDGGSDLEIDLDGDGVFETRIHLDGVEGGRVVREPGDGGLRILDIVQGGAAADQFVANGRAQIFSGGAGFDTVTLAASRQSIDLRIEGGVALVESEQGPVIALDGIEALRLSDGMIRFDSEGAAGSAYRLYQAAFARTPDDEGLAYWIRGLDKGLIDLGRAAAAFAGSREFSDSYGTLDNAGFAAQLYQNILGREPDAGGLSFWTNSLAGGTSRGEVLLGFSESQENKAVTAADLYGGIFIAN